MEVGLVLKFIGVGLNFGFVGFWGYRSYYGDVVGLEFDFMVVGLEFVIMGVSLVLRVLVWSLRS